MINPINFPDSVSGPLFLVRQILFFFRLFTGLARLYSLAGGAKRSSRGEQPKRSRKALAKLAGEE